MYDVCIIGAGVVGSAIARELSRYNIKVCLLEKSEDVACGTTKANSGVIHGGYDAKHGTLKGQLSARGNSMFKKLDEELKFGFSETGSFVVGFDEEDEKEIRRLYENGLKNGARGLAIVDRDFIFKKESYINKEVKIGLYCSTAGVISPYEFTIALAENAVENGVQIYLNTEVTGIKKTENVFTVYTNNKEFKAKYIINAAGLYSDKIANMVGINDFRIIPRRGQYVLFDKDQGYLVNSVIFKTPKVGTKGVLVTRTYHGNLLMGPSAEYVDDKENLDTTSDTIEEVLTKGRKSVPGFDNKKIITSFAGLRASTEGKDFIIEESEVKGFINVAGIDSPGLTSAPSIAVRVLDILSDAGLDLKKKSDFNSYRNPITRIEEMDPEEINRLIQKDSRYGRIICRCESITEGEIIEALNRPIRISSIDGIKRRVRATGGRCQGGFCTPRIMEIISRELNIPIEVIQKRNPGSYLLVDRTKKSFKKDGSDYDEKL